MVSFIKITRCFYTLSKEAFRPKRNQKYFKFYSNWIYFLDCFMFWYSFRLIFVSYLIYNNYQTTYNFKVYDPIVQYCYLNRHVFDSFSPMLLLMFEWFNYICCYSLQNFNSNTTIWRFWYSLIVENQDHYYDCMKGQDQIDLIYEKELTKAKSNFKLSHYCPLVVSELIYKCTTKIQMIYNLDNIDKGKFFEKPINVLPNISEGLRIKILLTTIICDKFILLGQVFICKYIVIQTSK